MKFICFAFIVMLAQMVRGLDTMSDTWVATDGLGRTLPTFSEVGGPRTNRTVALFYFLWHDGARFFGKGGCGPYDITKILAQDPDAMAKGSPLLGPMYAPHHWGEPLFGYYLSTDRAVIRKHAQMLSDAGVDLIVFDVTNGPTYDESWGALLDVFAEVRATGGQTPQVAFLCPFSMDPPPGLRGQVVRHLWEKLYGANRHPDLWFRWRGKPLIMAHPTYCMPRPAAEGRPADGPLRFADRLAPGHTLGQLFTAQTNFFTVSACTPTYGPHAGCACTLTLRKDGPAGTVIATRRFSDIADNETLELALSTPAPAGTYYLELSDPAVSLGWWSQRPAKPGDLTGGAYRDGKPCGGFRTFTAAAADSEATRIRDFFTWRRPIPGYGYKGPSPLRGGWSWLEIHPQHVYGDFDRNPEMMSVGAAQNATPEHIWPMSAPGAMGRRWHDGRNDPRPEALAEGPNFQEQWDHALKAAPSFLFVTGWNEWWAARFPEWMGWSQPGGVFPDQFDAEHSRDCEPVVGHWGDAYYWQLAANIRRYKGVRQIPPVVPRPIRVDGDFSDWREVAPEFHDTPGDPVRRDHPGWAKGSRYVDASGRNDIVAAKVSYDASNVYFYVRTATPLTRPEGGDWMRLHLPGRGRTAGTAVPTTGRTAGTAVPTTGRTAGTAVPTTGRTAGAEHPTWGDLVIAPADYAGPKAIGSHEIELAIPWTDLGGEKPAHLDFKWTDNCLDKGDWTDFTLHGDAAPNDRYLYRAVLAR